MLHYAAELRASARGRAELIESIATGYAACKSKEGGAAMERVVRALRAN